jgi:hypothetical protein
LIFSQASAGTKADTRPEARYFKEALGTTGMYRPPIPADPRLKAAGAGMRKIRTSMPDRSWIQGPGPCDLWTWHDDQGAIKEQELTFFGRTIVIKNGKLYTGLSHESGGGVMGKTGLLDFDTNLDTETLIAAYKVLGSIPAASRTPHVDALEKILAAELNHRGVALPAPLP